MNKLDIIVFDFETGGLSPEKHEAISIAGKAYNARSLEPYPVEDGGEFYSLMKPLDFDRLDDRALAVNKITREELRAAPEQKVVWKSFCSWVKGYNPKKTLWTAPLAAGKNVPFDMGFLKALNKLHFGDKPPALFSNRRVLDLDEIFWLWFENETDPPDQKMDTLRPWFGLSSESAHNALTDVRQTGALIMKFLNLHRTLQARKTPEGKKIITFKGSFAGMGL